MDAIKIPRAKRGNECVVIFMGDLTKWRDAFPAKNQTSLTLAKLFVEEVVSQHGVPCELLSDLGSVFLSKIFFSVHKEIQYDSVQLGPGKLCLTHHLSFYSFIYQNFTYYAFQVAYYSRIIPSVCRGSHVQIE